MKSKNTVKKGLKKRGKVATVYTLAKVKIVKARVKKGEFVTEICKDLGMDDKNFWRFCRRQGIKIMTKALLKANYKRRDNSRTNKKVIAKKVAPKKVAKKSTKKKK